MDVILGLILFFGLGLLGGVTLYWTVRYSQTLRQVIFFGLLGTALMLAQCLLLKFLTYFGRAFGGKDASIVVIICAAVSGIAVLLFVVAAIHKFSNRKE